MSDKTLQYYNANAEAFDVNTFVVDFSQIQQEFLNTLPTGRTSSTWVVGREEIRNIFLSMDIE